LQLKHIQFDDSQYGPCTTVVTNLTPPGSECNPNDGDDGDKDNEDKDRKDKEHKDNDDRDEDCDDDEDDDDDDNNNIFGNPLYDYTASDFARDNDHAALFPSFSAARYTAGDRVDSHDDWSVEQVMHPRTVGLYKSSSVDP
jgi:hypothetical protein